MKKIFNSGKKGIVVGIILLAVIIGCGSFMLIRHKQEENRQQELAKKAEEKEKLLESYQYGEYFDTETKKSVYSNRNIMIFVPHEDDDVNLMCGQLEQYIQYGSTIKVVYMTNGDRYDLAKERLHEAVNVLTSYGIPEENIIFIGYGDKWATKYGHIYHAPENEAVMSANEKWETYGADEIKPYKQEQYTRKNLLTDIVELITDNRPDLLFCNDYDSHCDHRCLSLLFEEAMGIILKNDETYQPEVYKGFCYFEEWHGPEDFYADNLLSSHYNGENMEDNPTYLWDKRVRFPVSQESATRVLEESRTYQALEGYASQSAVDHAESIINGDKLFWRRRTDNLALHANIAVSSGNKNVLNDFKLLDTSDVLYNGTLFDEGIWIPTQQDQKKEITVSFSKPEILNQIVLYDNPSVADNIKDAEIEFSDGTVLSTGKLNPYGASSVIQFEAKKDITQFTIRILQSDGEQAGLNEVEAFSDDEKYSMQIVKLMDADENFAYDYQTNNEGLATFQIYEYPEVKGRYEVYLEHVEGGCIKIQDKSIGIYCPPGTKGTLILYDPAIEQVVDAIWISNPNKE